MSLILKTSLEPDFLIVIPPQIASSTSELAIALAEFDEVDNTIIFKDIPARILLQVYKWMIIEARRPRSAKWLLSADATDLKYALEVSTRLGITTLTDFCVTWIARFLTKPLEIAEAHFGIYEEIDRKKFYTRARAAHLHSSSFYGELFIPGEYTSR